MTPFEWLKMLAAEHNKANFLHAPQFEGARILLFSASKNIMPLNELGHAAHNFIKKAPQRYQQGEWSPPISLTQIIGIYNAFVELNHDLNHDPQWNIFWETYFNDLQKQKLNNIELDRLKSLIDHAQAQILTGYRLKVISVTDFLLAIPKESAAEKSLKENRCRSFFQQINRCFREISAEACYTQLITASEKMLCNDLESAESTFKMQLNSNKKIEYSITYLEKVILQIKSKLEFEFLGDKAKALLEPIEKILIECLDMKALIDSALKNMSQEALSGVDARILIDLEMPLFEKSPCYQNLSENSAHFSARYLSSQSLLQIIHDDILSTQLQKTLIFFNEPLPFWKIQDSINSFKNFTRKREFIEILFNECQNDKINFPDPPSYLKIFTITITQRKKAFIKMLQKIFLNTLKREYNEVNQDLTSEYFNMNVHKPILMPLGKSSILDTISSNAQDELKDFIENLPERTTILKKSLNLFDPSVPMEIVLSLGLLNKLSTVVRYGELTSQIPITKLYQSFEGHKNYIKLLKGDTGGEIDIMALSKALRMITDLNQRKKTIMQLFEYIVNHEEIHPDDCVPILQELFINTIKEEVRRMAPKTIEEKNTTYQVLLAPAKNLALLKYGNKKMTEALDQKLDALIERISI